MWFWHFWGAAICLTILIRPLVSVEARDGAVFAMLIVPLWNGVVAASLCKDFLTRPFSIVLPRHELVWRRTLFALALVVASVCALVILFSSTGTPGEVAVTVWQTFLMCLAMFMVGVLVATGIPNAGVLPALITGFVVIVLNEGFAAHIRLSAERALLASPLVTTVTCAAVLAAAWKTLGSRGFARKLCGTAFMPVHASWNTERQAAFQVERKLRRMRRSPGTLMRSLERFFTARMRAMSGHSTLKSLWGTLYIQFVKAAPATASNFIALSVFFTAITLVLGFYHPHRLAPDLSGANLMLFLVCIVTAEYRINPYAGLMLNISRKNRFRSLLFSAVVQWLVVGGICTALMAVSIFAQRFLTEMTLYGTTYSYTPIHPKAFFVFSPMIPFYFISQVLFPKHHVIALLVITIAGTLVFFTNGQKFIEMSAWGLFVLQMVSWLPFVALIRHYCFTWDIKLNGQ